MDVKGKKARRRARGDDGDLQGVFAAQTTASQDSHVVRDFLVHVALAFLRPWSKSLFESAIENTSFRVTSFCTKHREIIFSEKTYKAFFTGLFFDHPISLLAFVLSFFGDQEGAPFHMPYRRICNTCPCCTKEFHKKLFDLQVCILCHVNLSQGHTGNKSFPLILVQVCLSKEHQTHPIVGQRELCTMGISQNIHKLVMSFMESLTLFICIFDVLECLLGC